MDFLRRLRLNCLLAPLLPLLLLLLLVQLALYRIESRAAARWVQQQIQALGLLAAAVGPEADVAAIHAGDPRWRGLAVVELDAEDRLLIRASAGLVPLSTGDPAERGLVESYGSPGAWRHRGSWLLAAALRDRDLRPVALLLANPAAQPQALIASGEQVGGMVLLLLVALILSWYLAARIWRPVEALQREAEAALRGERSTLRPRSSETAGVATAITELVEAYRSGRAGGDDRPS